MNERMLIPCEQCDQMDDFLKFLATNLRTKVAQIFGDPFGFFEKHIF